MTISIHHGPPGSYKTSGVVQDYFIPAALSGRHVVTNIRGINVERTLQVLGEENVPDSFDITYIDTTVSKGRDKIARWFHWAPLSSLLLIDECSVCFPKKWRPADLDKLDFGTVEEAKEAGRPHDWQEAFDMHRHYNWDIVIMNPSIKTVRDDIRSAAEGAYKHANMATIGVKGRYKEGYHSAENNGLASNIQISKLKKIKKKTFALYDSTTTGKVKDTTAGASLFSSGKLLVGLFIIAAAFSYAFSSGGLNYFTQERETTVPTAAQIISQTNPEIPVESSGPTPSENRIFRSSALPREQANSVDLEEAHLYSEYSFRIIGFTRIGDTRNYIFKLERDGYKSIDIDSRRLKDSGYSLFPINKCAVQLIYEEFSTTVHCASPINELLPRESAFSRRT